MRYDTWNRRWPAPVVSAVALLLVAVSLAGCNIDAEDPTAILESELNDASGAEHLRRGALLELYDAVQDAAWFGGLLSDEFIYEQPSFFSASSEGQTIDIRASEADQEILPSGLQTTYPSWQALRAQTSVIAMEKLRAHARPGAREAHVGEMFALRGWAAMRLAEDYCPGFPLHEVRGFDLIIGSSVSTQEAFEYALAAFDSAAGWAADSARVLNLARMGRARTLLQLGRFADARAAAANVTTSYRYLAEYDEATGVRNDLASVPGCCSWWGVERSVADQEGGNGLDFVSSGDPRVSARLMGTAQDGVTQLYGTGKYASRSMPIAVTSGLEARLIEAEAALQTGDPAWLTILNDLRANEISPPLPALADPGTAPARVDLVFRERAFWLFASGARLGDLRRLGRIYGRSASSLFPEGAYWRTGFGSYGPATSLTFGRGEREFGAMGCTGS